MPTKIITVSATPPAESSGADYNKGAPLNATEFDQNIVNLRAEVDRKAPIAGPGAGQAFSVGGLSVGGFEALKAVAGDWLNLGSTVKDLIISSSVANTIASNAQYDGTNWRYIAGGAATRIILYGDGRFETSTALFGVAGDVVNWGVDSEIWHSANCAVIGGVGGGCLKLANGLILQWGTVGGVVVPGGAISNSIPIVWPVAFPVEAYIAVGSVTATAEQAWLSATLSLLTKTGGRAFITNSYSLPCTQAFVQFIAIGH